MMRGRITRLNGVPVEQAAVMPEARWALRSDRGLTYAARPAAGLAPRRRARGGRPTITARRWSRSTPALARGMGLKVGDTLTRQPARPRDHRAHRQSAGDRLAAARHQFRAGLCPGDARSTRRRPISPPSICRRPSEEALVRQVTERFPERLGDPGPRGAGRGRPDRRPDRRRGPADGAGHRWPPARWCSAARSRPAIGAASTTRWC